MKEYKLEAVIVILWLLTVGFVYLTLDRRIEHLESKDSRIAVLEEKVAWTESEILDLRKPSQTLYERALTDGKVNTKH